MCQFLWLFLASFLGRVGTILKGYRFEVRFVVILRTFLVMLQDRQMQYISSEMLVFGAIIFTLFVFAVVFVCCSHDIIFVRSCEIRVSKAGPFRVHFRRSEAPLLFFKFAYAHGAFSCASPVFEPGSLTPRQLEKTETS